MGSWIAGRAIQQRRKYSRQRQAAIAANPELQERELIKLAALASARPGITVFKIAIDRWHSETSQRDLPHLIRELLDELEAVTGGG